MSFKPTGPYTVGVRDVRYCASADRLDPSLHISGRLFYPCTPGWFHWPTFWIGHWKYAAGYAHYPFWHAKGWKYHVMENVLTAVAFLLGSSQTLPVYYNAKPLNGPQPFPLVLFSHGLAGNRNTYSNICTELASQGYAVFAVEHADGTASAAHLASPYLQWTLLGPGQAGHSALNQPTGRLEALWQWLSGARSKGTWRLYGGFGDTSIQEGRTRFRVSELRTAVWLLSQLAQGEEVPGLSVSGTQLPGRLLRGLLDLSRVAACGHSYGGATVAAAVSEHEEFHCGVALDPWWTAVPHDSAALRGWRTQAPLLIIGSHDWNMPDAAGKLKCNGGRQQQLLQAARSKPGAPGALLIVPRDSNHHSFDDILLRFGRMLLPLLRKVFSDFHGPLDARVAHDINCWAIKHFVEQHLPSAHSHCTAAAGDGELHGAANGARNPTHAAEESSSTHLDSTHHGTMQQTSHSNHQKHGLLNDNGKTNFANATKVANGSGKATAAGGVIGAVDCCAGPLPLSQQHVQAYKSRFGDQLALLQVSAA